MEDYNLTSDEKEMLTGICKLMGSSDQELETILNAYRSIKMQGSAHKIDAAQFLSIGIPLYRVLADIKGVTTTDIASLFANGLITFEEIKQAFINMTSEEGLFYNPAKS